MDIRFRNQFFETFPVLSCKFGSHIGIDFTFLQALLHIVNRIFLTVFGQSRIQLNTTIGRSVRSDIDIGQFLIRSFGSSFDFIVQSVHLFRFQLLRTQVGLLNKEHNVGRIFFFYDTLELIGRNSRIQLLCVSDLGRRNNAFCNSYTRKVIRFFASLYLKCQLQFRFPHSRNVFEINRH